MARQTSRKIHPALLGAASWSSGPAGRGPLPDPGRLRTGPRSPRRDFLRSPSLGPAERPLGVAQRLRRPGSADPRAGGVEGQRAGRGHHLGRGQPARSEEDHPGRARLPRPGVRSQHFPRHRRGRPPRPRARPVRLEQLERGRSVDQARERQPAAALPSDRGPRPGPRPDDGPAAGGRDRPLEGCRGAGRSGGRRRGRHLGPHGSPRAAWNGTPRPGRRGSCASSPATRGRPSNARARTPTA